MARATPEIRAKIRHFAHASLGASLGAGPGAGASAMAALALWQAVPGDRA
ncbi:MAG: hypothetical protein IIC03_07690 [Proteobacteria bacterium]|nr:hypothetical protein [Pseudomonadota bacterium]